MEKDDKFRNWGVRMAYTILVVDDVAFNRTVLKAALKDMEDVEFTDAVNGVQALEVMESADISLVILDLMMPEKNGFDVLRDMRQDHRLKDIPVIVYSAMDEIDSISEALSLGAYDYFTKPLKPKQMNVILPMKVKNAIQLYEQQKTIQALNEKMSLEMLLANVFQQSLLKERQSFAAADMYGKFIPCHEVGGDFYDCVEYGEDLWFIMADVSGYGVAAAMLSSMLKVEFQHCVQQFQYPNDVLRHLNNVFCNLTKSNYCLTAFVGLIKDKTLWYSNAGQSYPVFFQSAKNEAAILRESSASIGLVENEEYELHQTPIAAGDIVVTYTEGLLENKLDRAGGADSVYEELSGCVINRKHLLLERPTEFFETIFQLFGDATDKKTKTDMAMMVLCAK